MKSIILTTKDKPLRLYNAEQEIAKLGIKADVFYAIENADAKLSFNLSMQHIMRNNDGVLAFFEDDVIIKDNNHYQIAINQLPTNWELCYLGANITGAVERYSDNLFKMNGGWTTHGVLFNNPKKICENYIDTTQMFDDWLSNNIHPRGNTFIISPMIAWQQIHHSMLWDRVADYTDILNNSANKLI